MADDKVIEVRLRGGETIRAKLSDADLDTLHRTLEQSQFIRVGDDAIVRADEVRSVRMRHDSAGDQGERPRSGGSTTRPRRIFPLETKPFFLTSEFLLGFVAWFALMLTTLASDAIDARAFWLMTAALALVYALSRGLAKAHTESSAWDPREEWRGGGTG